MGKPGPKLQSIDGPKFCHQCATFKDRTKEFWHKNGRNRDGLSDTCSACRSRLRKKEPRPKAADQLTKVCPKCKIEKPMTPQFWWRKRSEACGYQAYCKTCAYTPTGGKGGKLIPAGPTRTCPKCGIEKPFTTEYWFRSKNTTHGFQGWCKPCNSATSNAGKLRDRIAVLTHYSPGTPACSCCGESQVEVLDLDHIGGGGNKHRKTLTMGFYRWIINNNFPDGFRILCRNCNWYCGTHKGTCYHNK